jgi:hypothetical protein
MRQTYLTLAAIAILFTATNCKSETEKVEEATADVVEAGKDLEEANTDYQAEVDKYKIETAEKIAENERLGAQLKNEYFRNRTLLFNNIYEAV